MRLTATAQRAARYWHTLRHLRPVQIYGRVWHRLPRRPDLGPAPAVRHQGVARWARPAARASSLVGPSSFRLLGETREVGADGWDDPRASRLWRYNLHYFDDLNARGSQERAAAHLALLERWVRENPPGVGTGWEPYPTSLRIVNWVKWALGGGTLPRVCVESLAVQCRWLARRLEIHLLGNHLFANAKALVFGGVYFQGPEAAAWAATGLRVLGREVPEQLLRDGGHFERSTMYHALALEDALDLCNLAAAFPGALPGDDVLPDLARRVPAMQAWLAALCHPDGEIAFFNDAAVGVAPAPSELARYGVDLGMPPPLPPADGVLHLDASGYVRLARGSAVALLDVAPVGPDYLPGHAHADTLSFELSIAGHRVVVNSGTSEYGTGPERLRQRGTAAHSTVEVDGLDSSEVWSGFRVARRARPFGLALAPEGDALRVRCSHDGYRRLAGAPVHTRTWRLGPGELRVEDEVAGRRRSAVARFHLHPALRAERAGDGFALALDGGPRIEVACAGGEASLVASTWHPAFGSSVPSRCLAVALAGDRVVTTFRW